MDAYRKLNATLADPRLLRTAAEAAAAVRGGRAIVLITGGIHSTEVGTNLAPVLLAYRLATDTSATTRAVLDNVILVLVPSLNPDGVTIVTKWYDRTLGTPAEGTSPPELYHHYVGHDDNRDWYAFTQIETQLTVDSIYGVWHPAIAMDLHQQLTDGSPLSSSRPTSTRSNPTSTPSSSTGTTCSAAPSRGSSRARGRPASRSTRVTMPGRRPAPMSTTTAPCGSSPRPRARTSPRPSTCPSTSSPHESAGSTRGNAPGTSQTRGPGAGGRCGTS